MNSAFNAFLRHRSCAFVMRGNTVIVGVVDDLQPGDLCVCGDVKGGYLRASSFDGKRWRQRGGFWDRRVHRMPLEIAEAVLAAVKHLRMHEFLAAAAVTLKLDAQARAHQREQARASGQPECVQAQTV